MTVDNGTYAGLNINFMQIGRRFNVDASTRCNLLCPGCTRTQDMEAGNRNWDITDLKLEYLQALLHPRNKISCVTYNGALSDPIYSGTMTEQLEYINTLEFRPRVVISTNGSGRNEKWWKHFSSLLRKQDWLQFSIDGLEDTNHIYRVNARWNSIMAGVKTVRENWNGSLWWRYVVFEHNYHQVGKAKQLAEELGFDKFQPMVGDRRTPAHMLLKSATWQEILNDIS